MGVAGCDPGERREPSSESQGAPGQTSAGSWAGTRLRRPSVLCNQEHGKMRLPPVGPGF